ncbi:MAG: ECF-type sigma factor, partial [Planctomycetota bacterium]
MSPRRKPPALTQYLQNPQAADENLVEDAVPVVYKELRALAGSYLRRARSSKDLHPTSLVHEVYIKLLGESGADVNDREHFYALAARAMRQLCVDHARARQAKRRGGDQVEVTLDEAVSQAA